MISMMTDQEMAKMVLAKRELSMMDYSVPIISKMLKIAMALGMNIDLAVNKNDVLFIFN